MRRIIVITAAVLGAIVIFIGVILFYAATNLNSIIAERRQTILDKVSTSLGRPVHAADIKVSLGWGIMADVTGVQVSDDPAISKQPPDFSGGWQLVFQPPLWAAVLVWLPVPAAEA